MATEPSFGRLVFSVAVRNTCQAFGSTRRDFLIGVICVSFGFCSYWYFKGLPVAMEQAASVAAFTFGPLGIVVTIVFLWNLLLAPTEIIYAAFKAAPSASAIPSPPAAVINWEIWKQRSQYTVDEFAAILAHNDPIRPMTHEAAGFRRLLLEDMEAHRVPYEIDYGISMEGSRYKKGLNGDTKITRVNAIRWAEIHNFDVTHVRTD